MLTCTHTQDGEIPQIFTTCDSDAAQYWLPVLLAYKGLFLIVGIFLAAQTYNVKIKELRDSKLIVASVFGIAVISVVIAVVALAVRNEPVATYSVIGLFIMLLVTGILILLFVTRVSWGGSRLVSDIEGRCRDSHVALNGIGSLYKG